MQTHRTRMFHLQNASSLLYIRGTIKIKQVCVQMLGIVRLDMPDKGVYNVRGIFLPTSRHVFSAIVDAQTTGRRDPHKAKQLIRGIQWMVAPSLIMHIPVV